ncbi:MAG: hypothetical protein ACFFGZ_12950 [Candidatus Thorarchaeota archaeon]
MGIFDLLDFAEPWVFVSLAVTSWAAVVVVWFIAPDYVLVAALIALILTILAAILLFVPLGISGSAAVTDKATGKKRCRVCHKYYAPDQLSNNVCAGCRQTVYAKPPKPRKT